MSSSIAAAALSDVVKQYPALLSNQTIQVSAETNLKKAFAVEPDTALCDFSPVAEYAWTIQLKCMVSMHCVCTGHTNAYFSTIEVSKLCPCCRQCCVLDAQGHMG